MSSSGVCRLTSGHHLQSTPKAPAIPPGLWHSRKEPHINNHHLTPILITGGATLTALLLLRSNKPTLEPPPVQAFTAENLTERFVSAIPELTRELNLERPPPRSTRPSANRTIAHLLRLD